MVTKCFATVGNGLELLEEWMKQVFSEREAMGITQAGLLAGGMPAPAEPTLPRAVATGLAALIPDKGTPAIRVPLLAGESRLEQRKRLIKGAYQKSLRVQRKVEERIT